MKALLARFLSSTTMYTLMVRFLGGLLVLAVVLSYSGALPFQPIEIISTSLGLILVCYVVNWAAASLLKIKPNRESWLISALILSLVIGPSDFVTDWLPLFVAGGAAMASKYLLRFRSRHLFNPAAVGLIVMNLATGFGASWWVGIMPLTILVILGGFLIIYKVRRVSPAMLYIATYLITFLALSGTKLPFGDNVQLIETLLLNSPLFFFATVMLIEPATSPTTPRHRYVYAMLVAVIAVLLQRFASDIPYSLELSLLAGNIFTRALERTDRFAMTLIKKEVLNSTIKAFHFEPQPALHFVPGQFVEWSLPHKNADDRGYRRWFTISSSPTEKHVLLTTRFSEKGSSFKRHLSELPVGQQLIAHGLEGDFVLPADKTKPLVFIAGGIGITPFRSMIKFMLDKGEARDIVLIYAVKKAEDLIFMDIFNEAREAFGVKIVPVVSEGGLKDGYSGQVTLEILRKEIPDIAKQLIYISGPEPMVEAMERLAKEAGANKANIRQDFFPGYPNELLTDKG